MTKIFSIFIFSFVVYPTVFAITCYQCIDKNDGKGCQGITLKFPSDYFGGNTYGIDYLKEHDLKFNNQLDYVLQCPKGYNNCWWVTDPQSKRREKGNGKKKKGK